MLRTLSPLESFYVDHDITIVTVTDLTGKINSLLLQKAIDIVVKMHPLLASEILASDQGYYFSTRDTLDDKLTVIGKVDKEKRKKIILSELNKPLAKDSLFRFILLLEEKIGIICSQEMSLIMTTHHAVSDGVSAVALQEQIWQVYADIANNQSPTITSYPLMPAIEALIPTTFTKNDLADYVSRYAGLAEKHQPFVIPPKEKGDDDVEINAIRKKFTLKETQSIIARCKDHGVSVHGALCAANLLALRDMFGANGELDLSCHSPINVRSLLQPPVEKNAMFSAAIGCAHYEKVTASMTLWELGDHISNTIKSHIANGDIFKSMLTYHETRLKSKLAVSIGITNVGVVNTSAKFGKLKIDSINIMPRIPLPMLTASAATSGNKLTITYPYAKPYYSTNVIKKLAELSATYLLTAR